MKKTAILAGIVLVLSYLMNAGVGFAPTIAHASAGDPITLNAAFHDALVAAGVDADNDGIITVGEMEALTSLDITGFDVTDVTGIGYAVNLTSLSITMTSITSIPLEISALTKLETLDLSKNALTAAGLTASLWSMSSLTDLELEMNGLKSLPDGIGNLTNLQVLNLYGNKLTSLPASIGLLVNLVKLNMQQNELTSLPDEIGNLTNLQELTVWQNQLNALPDSIGNLSSLQNLDLDSNCITTLPSSLKNLTSLTRLILSSNLLTSLPSGVFENMLSLSSLDVSGNYLDPSSNSPDFVEINKAIANKATVNYGQNHYDVSLDYNGGTGPALPKSAYYYGEELVLPTATWASHVFAGWDWDGDGTVDWSGGQTVAVEPATLTVSSIAFKATYEFAVTYKTQSFGTIDGGSVDIAQTFAAGQHISAVPTVAVNEGYTFLGWSDGAKLYTGDELLALNLTSNKTFTATYEAIGTIHFADSAFKAALTAAGADANGDGFITEAEMQALTSLDLSGKAFTDMTGIEKATNLQSLNLSNRSMTSVPSIVGSLTSLTTLDLSGNKLSSFPTVVSGLSGLTTLNLSNNVLTTLPDGCFSAMTALASLDLSGNYFNPNSMPAAVPLSVATTTPQNSYTVSFNFNGGTGTAPTKTSYYYGEQVAMPAASKTGYNVVGWDTNADGKIDKSIGATVTLAPNPPTSATTFTFKAIYQSNVATLSGIGLTAGCYLKPMFSPTTYAYTITLYDYVGSVTLTPVKSDSKSSMRINSSAVSSLKVTLASSTAKATIPVVITANDGTTVRTYTLTIVRAAPALPLSKIAFTTGATCSPAFSSSTLAYTVLVPGTMSDVATTVTRSSTSAQVTINGASTLAYVVSLNPGTTRTIPVKVVAPLATDKTLTYTLTFKRGITPSAFTATPKVGSTPMLSPGGTNRMTFSYAVNGPGTAKLEIYKGGKWLVLMTRTETAAGTKTWSWDGKLSGVYLAAGAYTCRLTATANGISSTPVNLSVRINTYPTVTWQTVTNPFRATGKASTLCSFKVNYVTNAVVQVYTSSGKLAATVKSYTNLPASSTYTVVTWDGKATAGNAAGYAAGSLVPKGTYTIRITVGPKVYTKTITVSR